MFDTDKFINHLKTKGEMDPDTHDGSYKMVRETVNALAKVPVESLGVEDLDMLFFYDGRVYYEGVAV